MQYPLSTGQCARLLNVPEPKLSEAVRRGHIRADIPVLAGRRLWSEEAVREAAELLGRDPAMVKQRPSRGEDQAADGCRREHNSDGGGVA